MYLLSRDPNIRSCCPDPSCSTSRCVRGSRSRCGFARGSFYESPSLPGTPRTTLMGPGFHESPGPITLERLSFGGGSRVGVTGGQGHKSGSASGADPGSGSREVKVIFIKNTCEHNLMEITILVIVGGWGAPESATRAWSTG